MSDERDEIGDLDPERLLAAGLPGEDEGGIDPKRLARAFPNLEVLEMLGRGGMGVVYRARQRNLDREVAVKVLPPGIGGDAAFAERFAREAKALAKLDHPNIVRVYESGEADGLYFILMEYVDGVNLREAMRGGGLTPAEALRIVPQVCDALQYAHDRGIVHRDVKPENILLGRGGQVKIADFGLAKLVGDRPGNASLTGVGQVMGTAHYIAPEQIRTPKDVDHRADVYSLGVVFYEMLTGDLPIGRFPNPSEKASVDARIDAVVLRTLERERELRYQRAGDVKTGVQEAVSTPAAEATAPTTRGAAAPRLSALAVAGVLGLPAGLLVGLLALTWARRDEHAFLLGAAVALIGFVLSMIAYLQVKRSDGRLAGDKLAKAGIALPVVALVAVVVTGFFVFLAAGREKDRILAKMEGQAAEMMLRDRAMAYVTRLGSLGAAVTPSDLESMIAPSIRSELARTGPEEFLRVHGDEAGLAFFDLAKWPAPLRDYRYLGADVQGARAVVLLSGPGGTIRFPMVREDGEWYLGLGRVEVNAK